MDEPFEIVEIVRHSIVMIMLLAGPALAVSAVVGFFVGFLQGTTQIQDPTVSFVAKLVTVLSAMAVLLPWLIEKLSDYVTEILAGPFHW
jgi:flagellar biosynthetic protein FliQ